MLKGHLPVLVLGLVRDKPVHGYALAKEIKRRGAEKLRLGEGTLYPLLYRLEAQGLIRGRWERGTAGKSRKVYMITSAGRRKLRFSEAQWRDLRWLMRQFLGEEWEKA
jgi:PadR family transcriptional regulator PadR